MHDYILAIDQGTTSSRALVFDRSLSVKGIGQQEFTQHYPASGEVEHDPQEIFDSTVATVRTAMDSAGITATAIAAIGITNQRETTILWDRQTAKPIHRAIVWQDRRTAPMCRTLAAQGLEPELTAKTGLRLDPYFSASKIAWLLDNVEGARRAAEAGRIAFGTVDSWLLYRLTDGRVHATDATNACRTALYDIHKHRWDETLCEAFGIPMAVLPQVHSSNAHFGSTDAEIFGASIPILGMAGDQHAATIGQCCFSPGMMKTTYGTGCFAVLNTGAVAVPSSNRLLTTIAYDLDGETTYALEGAIFIAGAAVQWLRDGLGVIAQSSETERLAAAADPAQDVIVVPAFVGLGAPYWEPDARGAVFGLTRNTGPKELARAVLQANAFQTRDLLEAMRRDWQQGEQTILRVDGGMVANDIFLQMLADTVDSPVERPILHETTAMGAAWLAGAKAGILPTKEEFANTWQAEARFSPSADAVTRERAYNRWQSAVASVIGFAQGAHDQA
ncbi:MAG: glycerol kinase GlpK [Hyphomicrobiaceae bacterium]|nr:glycerol kinase GlpK [Hyphomicrobiaceae bacterium]MCC0009595.1 glycerol kinase GlpK [Hyphomicrobiaceae bacterium]